MIIFCGFAEVGLSICKSLNRHVTTLRVPVCVRLTIVADSILSGSSALDEFIGFIVLAWARSDINLINPKP